MVQPDESSLIVNDRGPRATRVESLGPATGRQTYHLLQSRPYPRSLSLVIPMYNEESMVPLLRSELEKFLADLRCETEVVLVNDGSSDGTLSRIALWAAEDRRIIVLQLSRNFGHQIASTAGLDHATGDAVVLMDADLQDPLPVIHEMIACYREGYDVVYGQRAKRTGESAFKRFSAWAFYRFMQSMVYKQLPVDVGDFRLISRDCLNAVKSMRETHRFLRGMVAWVGFPQCAVRYERAPRASGETKYPLNKMIAFAWTAATSFSTLPLQFSIFFGILVGAFSAEEAVRAVISFLLGRVVPGWTSLMIVTSLIGSALLISLGILGQYVGRIYEQSKDRPLYLVSRSFNLPSATNRNRSN